MPLLRNGKSVNKCFDDTFNDKNVANHLICFLFANYNYHVCTDEVAKNSQIISMKKRKTYNSIRFLSLMQSQLFLREGEVRDPLLLAHQK